MPTYQIVSLVDITRSNPNRNETDLVKLSQQSNFNSLIQAIGLRSNVEWDVDPIEHNGALPSPFEGKAAYWSWEFSVERDEVFLINNDPVGLLKQDVQGVPIITDLNETIDITPSVFQTHGPNINIWFEIKV